MLSLLLQDDRTIEPLTYGRIASYYYLRHQTIGTFKERLKAELPVHELLSVLTVSMSSRGNVHVYPPPLRLAQMDFE